MKLTKGLVATVIAGTLTVGAGLVWNGGDVITGAVSKVQQMTQALTGFKANEKKLADKIGSLKAEVERLQGLVDAGAGDKNELLAQIDELNKQIEGLEAEKTTLAEENTRLTGELTKANEDVETLRVEMDNLSYENPMSEEEMNNLLNGGGTTTPEEEQVATGNEFNITTYKKYEYKNIRMTVNKDGSITLYNIAGDEVQQPLMISLMNTNGGLIKTHSVEKGDKVEITVGDLEYMGSIQVLDNRANPLQTITITR